MRLFTAIDIPNDLQLKLYDSIPELYGWKTTESGQFHITLLFLGECTDDEMKKISDLLRSVSFAPFELTVKGFGVFPDQKNPQILWAGINKTRALMELQSNISETLQGYGSGTDHPDYIPHITLARRKIGAGRDQNIEGLIQTCNIRSSFPADRFFLKQSVLLPEESRHEVLEMFAANDFSGQNHNQS